MSKNGWNGLVDAALTVGFLMTFFIDMTGLSLHQWLGMLLLLLVGYHVMLHLAWCKAVVKKAFRKIPLRMRNYCLIDLALLIGFAMILVTGLVISTWLDLSLRNYPFWRDLHIDASYVTLLLIALKFAVKIGFNRRRMAKRMRDFVGPSGGIDQPVQRFPTAPALKAQPAWVGTLMTRRRALSALAVAGIAASLPVYRIWLERDLLEAAMPVSGERPQAPLPETPPQYDLPVASESSPSLTRREPLEAVTPAGQESPKTPPVVPASPVPQALSTAPVSAPLEVAQASHASSNESTCSIRCSKQCVWPEKCRLYVDANGNGRCDLGECM